MDALGQVQVSNMFSFCFMLMVVLSSLGGEFEGVCLVVALVSFERVN